MPVSEAMTHDRSATPVPIRLGFSYAKQAGVVLRWGDRGYELLAVAIPALETLTEVQRVIGEDFALVVVDRETFQSALTLAYQRGNEEAVQMAEDLGADIDLARLADAIPETGDLMDAEDDAPIIRLINAILSQAVKDKASDIHIETFEDRLSVRFRVDGILSEILSPNRLLAPLLVSRLKVMAKLDIAEKRVPQDGRISVRIAGHAIDIRMSTIPSAHGERIVLRLLYKEAGQLQLSQLAMSANVLSGYTRALQRPHGIILVTGPTGSGKTTTLYAGLTHINQASRNIMTIEDPVEYMLPGVGQTQVNAKVEMTFARGLRAILRQDPDVVMVGEIRDLETAEIAVQASLTGHLVLSTLHTNTAIGAITRLRDMGIEAFLLSSSLVAVMAQRLVRLLCSHCKEARELTAAERRYLALDSASEHSVSFHPVGCSHCNGSGYRGRTAIYEWIDVDRELQSLIHDSASEQQMTDAVRLRSPAIFEDGRQRVLAGATSLEEILRVTSVMS